MDKRYFIVLSIFLIGMVSAIPQIHDVSISPENPTISEDIKICAGVIDDFRISIVRINLRREEPFWNWGLVMNKEDNKYCKTLSPNLMRAWEISEDKTISYYISAKNELGENIITEIFYFTYQEEVLVFCGDGICDEDENCSTCSNDCGECEIPFQNQTSSTTTSRNSHSHKKFQIGFCEVNWKCSGWGECVNGLMTRQCYDENHCEYAYNKPTEEIGCDIFFKSLVKKEKSFNSVLFGAVFTLFLMGLLIFLLTKQNTK